MPVLVVPVLVVPVLVVPVLVVGVAVGLKLTEKVKPAGTWLTLRPCEKDELDGFDRPGGKAMAGVARPVMLAVPDTEAEPDVLPLIATALMVADAGVPACALASAVRSLRSTSAETPLRSSCTAFVNCWLLGSVWRIDSYSAVTRRPEAVAARGLATSAARAAWPAPESNTRSSKHEADSGREGMQ